MSVRRVLAVAAVMTAIAVPATTWAGANAAFDGCVKSFVATHFPKEQPIRVRKEAEVNGPLVLQHRRSYTIDLVARSTSTGAELAQARCVADARGRVLVMDEASFGSTAKKADMVAAVVSK